MWQPCELLYTCYLLTYLLTKKCKTEKVKTDMLRSNSKSLGNHVGLVSPEEEKERLQWERFAEKEGFRPGRKSGWVMEN